MENGRVEPFRTSGGPALPPATPVSQERTPLFGDLSGGPLKGGLPLALEASWFGGLPGGSLEASCNPFLEAYTPP